LEQSALTDSPRDGKLKHSSLRRILETRPLRAAAGWIITGSLIYAPFVFGSVPTFAIQQLNLALGAAASCWFLDCLLYRKVPKVPIILVLCGIIALALGWFMTWNARSTFAIQSGYLVQTYIHPHRPSLPGALERMTARLTMQRLDSLFAGLLTASDLARDKLWRKRWVVIIAGTGAAIACFGVAQQAGMATFVATRMNQLEGEYFATFNYHGNAGAYMNLALPLSFAVCLYTFETRKPAIHRCAGAAMFGITLIGIMANTSRGAQAVSILIVIGMGGAAALRFVSHAGSLYRYRKVVWPLIALLFVGVVGAVGMHSARNAEKWRELPSELAKNSSRWQVWRVTVPMAKSAGALGHGPGSFKLLLPQSPMLSDALLSRWVLQPRIIPGFPISMWSMAHNDYLQTWVEFGWLGLMLALSVLIGGVTRSLLRIRAKQSNARSADGYVLFGVTAAVLGVIVNSLFDFPLQVASIQVTVIVLLGICWSSSPLEEGKSSVYESVSYPADR